VCLALDLLDEAAFDEYTAGLAVNSCAETFVWGLPPASLNLATSGINFLEPG
jgi:hypothetical protein